MAKTSRYGRAREGRPFIPASGFQRVAVPFLVLGLVAWQSGCDEPPETPQAQPREAVGEPLDLDATTVIEGSLRGGQRRSFPITLNRRDYVHLVVEQQGIDLVLHWIVPDGRHTVSVDSPTGSRGPEHLRHIAEQAGSHRVELTPLSDQAPAGRFRLEVRQLRQATAEDEQRIRARSSFLHAEAQRTAPEAIELYGEALRLWLRLGETFEAIRTLRRRGQALARRDEQNLALADFDRALAMARSLGDSVQIIDLSNLYGRTLRRLGQLDTAVAAYREVWRLAAESKDLEGQAAALNNLAAVDHFRGRAETALLRYHQALDIWRRLENRTQAAITLGNIGASYNLAARLDEALDALGEALAIRRAAGNERAVASLSTEMGWAHYRRGRPEAALPFYRQAIALAREGGYRFAEAGALNRLAAALVKLERHGEALAALRQALTIFEQLDDPRNIAHTLTSLAALTADPVESSSQGRRALKLFRRLEDPNGEAAALYALAETKRRHGQLGAARDDLETALARLEELRLDTWSMELRQSFFADRSEYFERYVDVLMALAERDPESDWEEQALEATERNRARTLLDSFFAPSEKPDLDGPRHRRLRDLDRKLLAARREQRPAAQVDDLERRLRASVMELERERAERRRTAPPSPQQPWTAVDLETIRHEWLDEETLLLVYALGAERSFLWAVTRDALDSHVLPPRARVEEAARELYGLLRRSHYRLARTASRKALGDLATLLLGPVADRLRARRILVLGDGVLLAIPFAALPGPGRGPLILDHEVISAPSLSVLHSLRRRPHRPPTRGEVAVLADPVFDPADKRLGRVAPPSGPAEVTARGGPVWSRLSASRREAEAILALAPPGRRLAALDFAASRATVLDGELDGYRILHFATHGIVRPEHPHLSAIALSAFGEDGRARESLLRADEIYHLDLPADLVVLSACQTTTEVRGEGLLGLPRAFFHAGAKRVLFSLWRVNDSATSALMEGFYRGLLSDGLTPPEALRQAQLALLENKTWSAPYFWAGFVLQGDWRWDA